MTIVAGDAVLSRAAAAMEHTCAAAGLDTGDARLVRSFASTVYHLPGERVVVRLAAATPGKYDRLAASLRVTRWLAGRGFPATRPLDVRQPVAADGFLVTFWHHEDDEGGTQDPAVLGPMLRRLHDLPAPPFELPVYDPFGPVRQAVEASRVLGGSDRDWLLGRCAELAETYYERLRFALPYGLIHGDAHRGNVISAAGRLLLCDWDSVSTGPREIDLVPTMQGARFGHTPAQQAAFCDGYGHDVRDWEGYPVLRDMRELRTLTAVLRNAHRDPDAAAALSSRLGSLRSGDDRLWRAF